uniref:Uncharacterized protein n=1 Tax=Anguilla anguilla TaxID=7936 RepID=A0A0E9RT60_ANGAN
MHKIGVKFDVCIQSVNYGVFKKNLSLVKMFLVNNLCNKFKNKEYKVSRYG